MGITQKVRLLLESKGFKALYDDNADDWIELAEDAKNLMSQQIPEENQRSMTSN